MCDTISDMVDSEPGYGIFIVITKFIVDLKRVLVEISIRVAIALREQLSKMASNKKRLATQLFYACTQSW